MKEADFGTIAAKYSNSNGRSVPRSSTHVGNESVKAMSEKEHLELVLSRIEAGHIDITHDEQDWVNILLGLATTFGEDGRDFAHRISQYWVGNGKSYSADDVDAKFDWCLQNGQGRFTIATVMAIAKDYGIDVSLPPGCYPEGKLSQAAGKSIRTKSAREQKEDVNIVISVQDFLLQCYEFRYNVLLGCVEIRNKVDDESSWIRLDDRIRDTMITSLHKVGIKVSKTNFDSYINSEHLAPEYSPATEYLNSLPKWDPSQPDYIGDFFDHIIFDDSEGKASLYRKFCKKWFLNFVALMCGQIHDNQLVLVFIGIQNAGKTFFCKNILPPALREYFRTIYPGESITKDQLLALSRYLLILFDELTLTKKNSDVIKALVSAESTEVREAYGRFEKKRQRSASLVGTGNEEIYIADVQGDRRYLSIKVQATKNLIDNPLPYEGAYAQALYLIQQPEFNHSLSPEELKAIEDNNADHVEADVVAEAISSYYRIPGVSEEGKNVSCADILEKVSNKLRGLQVGPREIGLAMSRMGFLKKKPNGKARYYVIEIQPADYEAECNRSGAETSKQLQQERQTCDEVNEVQPVEQPLAMTDIFNSAAVDALYSDKDEDDSDAPF